MEVFNKLRRLNRFMQKTSAEPVDFDEITDILTELLDCNTYVISRSRRVLSYTFMEGFQCEIIEEQGEVVKITAECNEKLWDITEPTASTENTDGNCRFFDAECSFETKHLATIPAYGANSRVGTLVLGRLEKEFEEEELVLSEYGATMVALETLRSKQEEQDARMRKQIQARMGLNTLSYSELELVRLLFENFEGDEQTLVTSEIADQAGISRSVVVNALGKLESARVISSRSLGMKGTHIKIINDVFLKELENQSMNGT